MKNDLLVKDEFDKYDGGVYGIFVNDECIYVGSTYNFTKRIAQHNECIAEESRKNPKGLYTYLGSDSAPAAEFRVLASAHDLARIATHPVNIDEKVIDGVEFAFIRYYKPKYNTKGIDMTFDFDHWDNDNWELF